MLHSINKTHKKEELVSLSAQIPEQIYTCRINQDHELLIDVDITLQKEKDFQVIPALLDSRANATFINTSVTERMGLLLEALTTPILVFNVDGSCNSAGDITHTTTITMDYLRHREELCVEVTNLGKNSLILGYTWLKKHNPVIDWQTGTMKFSCCPCSCHMLQDRARWLATLDKEAECDNLE